eukprot:1159005-Pleurochrysis_carterae.AAC.1
MDGGNDESREDTDENLDNYKNEHKANVQRRWDSRSKTSKAFQKWRRMVGHVHEAKTGGKEEGERGIERERENVWN